MSTAPEPISAKAKQRALRGIRRGMDLAGEWRHEEALAVYDEALVLVPHGLFAKMLWELKGNALHSLGRDAEADEAYREAQLARDTKKPNA